MATSLTTRSGRSLMPNWSRSPFQSLREEMDDLFNRFWGPEEGGLATFAVAPALDLSETDQEICVKMDLPGVKADEINIEMNANLLIISGQREEEKEDKGRTYHRVERRSGAFSRSIALPCPVEEDEVAAAYENGTLTVTLPKSEGAKTRKITVKS